jgi:hypothetical protein
LSPDSDSWSPLFANLITGLDGHHPIINLLNKALSLANLQC